MHSLETHQNDFARAILSHPQFGSAQSPRIVARGGVDAKSRLAIYRNNTLSSLTNVLLAVYPVTARLVAEPYFRFACNAFISAYPPSEPRLSKFGAGLPDFLRGFGQLRTLPFVAETARLEWEIACALDEPTLVSQPLTVLNWMENPEQSTIHLQPSLRLLQSQCPVMRIWTAHQQESDSALEGINGAEAERSALWRSGAYIRIAGLDPDRFAFLKQLTYGASLGDAAASANAENPMFDLASALAMLFGNGLVAAVGKNKH